MQELSQAIKDVLPKCIVIAGGGLPSAAYAQILNTCPGIDAICKGEGEIPLKNTLSEVDFLKACRNDVSFLTQSTFKLGKIPEASYITNLDEIPMLPYEYIDLSSYNSRSIDKRFSDNHDKREMSIHTSRGCPFKCVFCSNPSLHGYDVRFMTLERFEREIIRMKNDFGMNVLLIEDDHFFHDKERAKNILRILNKHNLRAEFPNGMAVYAINDEVASLLKGAGVSAVALAVESGSEYVLSRLMKKPLRTKLIRPAVESLRKYDIRSHVFIVAGIPGETDEHREETRQMLLDNKFDWVHMYAAIPIAGSRLYDICMEKNYINLDEDPSKFVATKSIIRTPTIDPEKLQEWIYKTQIEVNFVQNTNVKLKEYEKALPYFENVVKKYPNHAFGQLFLSMTKRKLDMNFNQGEDIQICRELFNDDNWASLSKDLNFDYRNEINKLS